MTSAVLWWAAIAGAVWLTERREDPERGDPERGDAAALAEIGLFLVYGTIMLIVAHLVWGAVLGRLLPNERRRTTAVALVAAGCALTALAMASAGVAGVAVTIAVTVLLPLGATWWAADD